MRSIILPVTAVLLAACNQGGSGKCQLKQLEVAGTKFEVMSGTWESQGNVLVGTGGLLRTTEDLKDAVIDFDVEALRSVGDREIGIGFHETWSNDDIEKGNGYAVNFTQQKNYVVMSGTNGDWKPTGASKGMAPSSMLKDPTNHVTITMAGTQYKIDFNGQTLSSFDDSSYPKGYVAFWVESTASKIKFSNIRITKK